MVKKDLVCTEEEIT